MLQCFRLKGVPLRDGPTFCSINGLLLILVETNEGVAQNLLVHINMVLLAQTFGLSGWTTKPTQLHMHVMVLCQMLNKEPCSQVPYWHSHSWPALWIIIFKSFSLSHWPVHNYFHFRQAVFAISPPFRFGKFVQSEPLDTTPTTPAMTVQWSWRAAGSGPTKILQRNLVHHSLRALWLRQIRKSGFPFKNQDWH